MLVVAIILYVFAGMFFGGGVVAGMLSPPDAPDEMNYVILGVTLAFAAIPFLIGAALLRFRGALGHLGWVLVGGAGMGGLSMLSIYGSIQDPKAREAFDSRSLAMFENADIALGGGLTIGALLLGALLIYWQSRKDARKRQAENEDVRKVFN